MAWVREEAGSVTGPLCGGEQRLGGGCSWSHIREQGLDGRHGIWRAMILFLFTWRPKTGPDSGAAEPGAGPPNENSSHWQPAEYTPGATVHTLTFHPHNAPLREKHREVTAFLPCGHTASGRRGQDSTQAVRVHMLSHYFSNNKNDAQCFIRIISLYSHKMLRSRYFLKKIYLFI